MFFGVPGVPYCLTQKDQLPFQGSIRSKRLTPSPWCCAVLDKTVAGSCAWSPMSTTCCSAGAPDALEGVVGWSWFGGGNQATLPCPEGIPATPSFLRPSHFRCVSFLALQPVPCQFLSACSHSRPRGTSTAGSHA